MTSLPPFNTDGILPPGDYALTLSELRESHLVAGLSPTPTWDIAWRKFLVDHLEMLLTQLWQCGIGETFVSGSFVENKDHPNDIDGYFVCDKQDFLTGKLECRLNSVSPDKIWTWDSDRKRLSGDMGRAQLPIWHLHHVDIWPHYGRVGSETDAYGHDLLFPSLFRRTKYPHREKGIIKIVRQN